VVCGHDHNEARDDRVHDGKPPPAARAEPNDDDADEDRPRHVYRRHRRQLVRDAATDRPVHRLPVLQAGVDEPE
jgi:hypothetical protein